MRWVKFVTTGLFGLSFLFPASLSGAATGSNHLIEDPALEQVIRGQLHLSSDKTVDADDLKKLTSLTASNGERPIHSLKGLEGAVNLTLLALDNQELTDLSSLASLKYLTSLTLSNDQITDLSAISGMKRLEIINVDHNQIQDLTSLSTLPALKILSADDNQIRDISFLSNLRLNSLYLNGNPVTDLVALQTTAPSLEDVRIDTENLNPASKTLLQRLEWSGIEVNNLPKKPDYISVYLNDDRLLMDHPVMVQDGTTLIQLRPLAEKMGFEVLWEEKEQAVRLKRDGMVIRFFLGKTSAEVNGQIHTLDASPVMNGESVFVPIRFVAESLLDDVQWDEQTKSIFITSDRSVLSTDAAFRIDLPKGWINKSLTFGANFSEYKIFAKNPNGTIVGLTQPMKGVTPLPTLQEYAKRMQSLQQQTGEQAVDSPLSLVVNGLNAIQFTSTVIDDKGTATTKVQTLIEGKQNYYLLVMVADAANLSAAREAYHSCLQSFQEVPSET